MGKKHHGSVKYLPDGHRPAPGIQEPGIKIDILSRPFLDLYLIRQRVCIHPVAHDHGIMVMVRIHLDHLGMAAMIMGGMILSGILSKHRHRKVRNRQQTHPVMAGPVVKARSMVFSKISFDLDGLASGKSIS